MNSDYEKLINGYIKAKDTNKPHLMKTIFSENATLKMKVKSENISFPSDIIGVDEITKTLIREFSHTYENIYTICISDTIKKVKAN